MSTWLVYIGTGAVLSFIGSIPFGTINVTTAEAAIRNGFRAALWVAFGAALVEFVQAFLSLKFSGLLMRNPQIEQAFLWASIPVFIGLGVYFIRRRPNTPKRLKHRRARGFAKGVVVSALNLLAIPYWIFCGSWLAANDWIQLQGNRLILLFSSGVFAGTFLLLAVYARLGALADAKSASIGKWAGPAAGIIFLLLAIVQAMRLAL